MSSITNIELLTEAEMFLFATTSIPALGLTLPFI
jgi:hypothetical protein